ncbi:LOW QUALITY PROTEIN: hypothetical protein IFM47457_01344 [Aspergillus lentulus]|nr:LOW QUALITY PROTEIN: hypothetical protein IFM47457_01344 [Aspergillus lentulus]
MCLSAPSLSSSASIRFAGCLADSHSLTLNRTFGLAPRGSLEKYALSNIQDLSAPLLFDFSVAEVGSLVRPEEGRTVNCEIFRATSVTSCYITSGGGDFCSGFFALKARACLLLGVEWMN